MKFKSNFNLDLELAEDCEFYIYEVEGLFNKNPREGVSSNHGRWIKLGCAWLKEKKRKKRERGRGWHTGQSVAETRRWPWIPAKARRRKWIGSYGARFSIPKARGGEKDDANTPIPSARPGRDPSDTLHGRQPWSSPELAAGRLGARKSLGLGREECREGRRAHQRDRNGEDGLARWISHRGRRRCPCNGYCA